MIPKAMQEFGGSFDGVGTIKDISQSHLLQVLLWVVMEPPEALTRDAEGHEGVWQLLRWLWHPQGYHAEPLAAGAALNGHEAARGLPARSRRP